MAKISRWFSLEEFLRSEAAARRGIDMAPNAEVLANLTHLAREILDPIRDAAWCPIVVTSGYRPKALNELIGGSAKSDHLLGLAADIHAHGHDVDWLVGVISKLRSIPLRQCINEYGQWVHVSIDLGDFPRREFLVANRVDGAAVYSKDDSVHTLEHIA